MTGIELPNLETFSYVAEAGSFTAAAESLGISQAAVSQRISLLEKDLGTAVFDRRAGRIQLTDAGQRLYEYAQKILQLHEKARSELVGFSPDAGGELALAASSVPGEHLLPAVLAEFRQKFPDVHVRATVTDSDSVFKDLEHGEAVLGLVGRKSDDSHLEYRPLATDHLVLIISPEHDMGRHGSICLEQLQQLPLVLRESGSGSRWSLELNLKTFGIASGDLNIALELGSNAAIKDAVRRGMGAAFLSHMAVGKEVKEGEFLSLNVNGLDIKRHFYVVFDRRKPLPLTARTFLAFLDSRATGTGFPQPAP